MLLESRGFPEGHPFKKVWAMPLDVPLPPIWLLGSSDYSARSSPARSARVCLRASFREFRRGGGDAALPRQFPPFGGACRALRDPGDACGLRRHRRRGRAAGHHGRANFVRRAKGEYLPLASPEEAAAYDYTPVDRARIAQNRARLAVGSPAR